MEYISPALKELYELAGRFQYIGKCLGWSLAKSSEFGSVSSQTLLVYGWDMDTKTTFFELFVFKPGIDPRKEFQEIPVFIKQSGRAAGRGAFLESWLKELHVQDGESYRRLFCCEFYKRCPLESQQFEELCELGQRMFLLLDKAKEETNLHTRELKDKGWKLSAIITDSSTETSVVHYAFSPNVELLEQWHNQAIDLDRQGGAEMLSAFNAWLEAIPKEEYYSHHDLNP